MSIARYQALCIDVVDAPTAAGFWSSVLGLQVTERDTDILLTGPTPQHTVWLNQVPEPKTVKNRVHLDVITAGLGELEALGARRLETFPHWTVMADPLEGQEFCGFVRDQAPPPRLKDLVIDSCDPEPIARWWCGVFGGELGHHPVHPWWWVDKVAGAPFESIDFVEVPEPKTAKNRVHLDVDVADVQLLLDAGATLLRPAGGDIHWHVLADPDGNEFCAFVD